MKTLITSLIILAFSWSHAQNSLPIYANVSFAETFDWKNPDTNSVLIPSPFAKPELVFPDHFNPSKARIKSITYYYSQNKSNPKFEQTELSDKRYQNLIEKYPELRDLNIKWASSVQNSCDNNECAKELFHGFVIEFEALQPKIVQKLEPAFGHDRLKEQVFRIDAQKECVIVGDQGTKILIPAKAFVDSRGKEVTGKVTLKLKEALTLKDIVFGNLNTITDEGEALMSKGMVKVDAYKGNAILRLVSGVALTVEVPTKFEDGYSYYQGKSIDGNLTWNNPVEIKKDAVIKMNEGNRTMWGFEYVSRPYVRAINSGDNLDAILVHQNSGDFYFTKSDYTIQKALDAGVRYKVAQLFQTWFDANELTFSDLEKKRYNPYWTTFGWFPIIWWRDKWDGLVTQWVRTDEEVGNIFAMNKLGWANIDCLARMKNTESTRFNVDIKSPEMLDDFKVALIVPSVNSMIPGFKRDNGTYAFTHGEYQDKVQMPKNEKVLVMASGTFNDQQYFAIQEYNIGAKPVVELQIEKMTREEMLKKLNEAF